MIGAIVLAAGRSRRFGAQKLLLPLGDRLVIQRVVDELQRSQAAHVLVVVGPQGGPIAGALVGRDVVIVTNTEPAGDMLSSVRCGLRALPPQCEGILVLPGDLPAITAELIDALLRAFATAGRGIVVPVHEGKRGHPLLFAAHYGDEVLTRYDKVGLCGLLQTHPADVLELDVATPAVLMDVDRPEDFRRVTAWMQSHGLSRRP
jgi:molybdenum cofactor cytidylyltransferase